MSKDSSNRCLFSSENISCKSVQALLSWERPVINRHSMLERQLSSHEWPGADFQKNLQQSTAQKQNKGAY